MTTTEILDNLVKALENRNKEMDDELTKFWYHWIFDRIEELYDDS